MAVAFTGFALLATIGAVSIAYVLGRSPGDAPRPVAPEEAPSTAAAASTAAAVTGLEVREFTLYVTEGAAVEIDGQPISRAEDGGTIVLQGAVGDRRHVKAVMGGREVSTQVLLTERGPAPPAVLVPPPESQPPAPRPSVTAQAKRPSLPAAPAASVSAAGTNTKLVTSFE